MHKRTRSTLPSFPVLLVHAVSGTCSKLLMFLLQQRINPTLAGKEPRTHIDPMVANCTLHTPSGINISAPLLHRLTLTKRTS